MDEIVQYGQNWTIWTKLDNMNKIGQYGQNQQYGQFNFRKKNPVKN